MDLIKKPLGTTWNNSIKAWESEGPEVLLDFPRFGIEVESLTPGARQIAERFRSQIWDTIDCRVIDTEAELWAYQKQGSEFLHNIERGILADEMGTGKTKQSLETIEPDEDTLVICENSVTFNWNHEVTLWTPHLKAGVVPNLKESPKRSWKPNKKDFWDNPPQVVIANYEKTWAADWPNWYKPRKVIMDEATRLKTSSTNVYKAAKRLLKTADSAYPLSGTPLEKNIVEYYNIMSLIRPAVLGSYMRFRDQHCILDWGGNIVGIKNLDLLRERIGPFMLRRTKKEVMKHLPAKLPPQLQFVELSIAERNAYDTFKSEFNNWLNQHGIGGDAMTQTIRMRQFCCSPDIFTPDLGQGSKFNRLKEIIDQWEGGIVIFCFFTDMTRRLRDWLGSHPRAYIDGSVTDPEERFERCQAYNRGELGKVFVCSEAAEKGVNLVGANLIIHYDQIYNPQKMHQREDRLHRGGQTSEVTVMHMICTDTIDYGIYLNNIDEQVVFDQVIEGAEEIMLKKLDAPRLRRMVEGR